MEFHLSLLEAICVYTLNKKKKVDSVALPRPFHALSNCDGTWFSHFRFDAGRGNVQTAVYKNIFQPGSSKQEYLFR